MANLGLIADFAAHSNRRGLQPTTIEHRTIRLRAWAEGIGKPLDEATEDDVEAFLARRRIEARTRYCWLSNISCFYRWGIRKGHFTADPAGSLDRPRLPRLLPRPIADDDLRTALDGAPPRERAMLMLASHMGLRCVEISRLHANDVLWTGSPPLVLVRGKGGKDRTVPLHAEVRAALEVLPRRGWVFRGDDGQALTAAKVSILLREHLRARGVEATGHQLRHWFGTRLYQTSHDLRLTQELLGHASPTTTSAYTAWARSDAAEAVDRVTL